MNKFRHLKLLLLALPLLLLSACVPAPPNNLNNACSIFEQYPKWYWATQDSQKKWQVPISVQMAIIHQESRFDGNAQPPRSTILWIIPWKRPTTAYGYAQAVEPTWEIYQKDENSGASRTSFADSTDFVGWYATRAHARAGINPRNAYQLYLAYHEGIGGYLKQSYNKKPWLIKVAKKVESRAYQYHYQLLACQNDLPVKHWWSDLF